MKRKTSLNSFMRWLDKHSVRQTEKQVEITNEILIQSRQVADISDAFSKAKTSLQNDDNERSELRTRNRVSH